MTGTAITEAKEFKEIYKLDVLQFLPIKRVCNRKDFNDEIYMTEREKYNAILKEIQKMHQKGRPILLGTESVEISEKLSRILRKINSNTPYSMPRTMQKKLRSLLEAGNKGQLPSLQTWQDEARISNSRKMWLQLGGLHVIGTTRHQSRRIDRQLRGRVRLGDPGSSKFFISFEDPFMRLFASPKLQPFCNGFDHRRGAYLCQNPQ